MKTVYIMRGLPGSGKSTWIEGFVKTLPMSESHIVCSADHYFTQDGQYHFDPSKLGEAHMDCFAQFDWRLVSGTTHVFVDNTNIRLHELTPYWVLARNFGYDVKIIEIGADPEICAKRNVHGVPEASIARMARAFEPVLPYMKNNTYKIV